MVGSPRLPGGGRCRPARDKGVVMPWSTGALEEGVGPSF